MFRPRLLLTSLAGCGFRQEVFQDPNFVLVHLLAGKSDASAVRVHAHVNEPSLEPQPGFLRFSALGRNSPELEFRVADLSTEEKMPSVGGPGNAAAPVRLRELSGLAAGGGQ